MNIAKEFDVSFNVEKEHPPTRTDPAKPVVEWLIRARSIPREMAKSSGAEYRKVNRDGHKGLGMIAFPLMKEGNPVKDVNCRILNPPPGVDKGHFDKDSSWKGRYFIPQGIQHDLEKPCYITESPIDSLSLQAAGLQSISVLSANAKPDGHDYLKKYKKLILAPDHDTAGVNFLKAWGAHFPESEAILPPGKGTDWNDILKGSGKQPFPGFFESLLPECKHAAALALSPTGKAYAEKWYQFRGYVPGFFQHVGCSWFSTIKNKGDETTVSVERCGKFQIGVVSYRKDTSMQEPEYRYLLSITPKKGKPIQATATGKDLATPRGLKEFFLSRARVSFEGGAQAATALATFITEAKAPEVNQLAIVGYDTKSKWYIRNHFAIDTKGGFNRPDKQGLYKVGYREWIALPHGSGEKAISIADNGPGVKEIHQLITLAWGKNGAAVLSWVVAGWFVNQIKGQLGFFPIASLYGDPASGKSALTVILNALQGRDGEGLPLSQLNTKKAVARIISGLSGMFTSLLEDNERNERAFDFSVILTGYNTGSLQVRAAFSNDNRTLETPFQGSLLFVQNNEPFRTKQEKQRVISLYFDHTRLNDNTQEAYEQLVKIPLPQLARFVLLVLQHRQVFETEWPAAYNKAVADLATVGQRRILRNHALILAFHRILCKVFKIRCDLLPFITETAKKKVTSSSQREHDIADYFFETIINIPPEKTSHCLLLDQQSNRVFINLAAMEQVVRNQGHQLTVNNQLLEALRLHPAFIQTGKNKRFPGDTQESTDGRKRVRKSWEFDSEKIQ